MLQFVYIWTLESFTIKELIIYLQYHAWNVHKHEFTICLQFISCLVIIRNNTYKYTMLLSDVEKLTDIQKRLHKRWYIVSNAYKLISSINIYPSLKTSLAGFWSLVTIVEQHNRGEKREKLKKDNEYQNVYSWKYSLGLLTIPYIYI